MLPLNPLFEREWRGRFRRLPSYVQLALIVIVMTAIVCFGVWRGSFVGGLTVTQWRANGQALINGYRWLGALVFWTGALLLGATSVSDEKASATWEHLLLCPTGGRGLAMGKVASAAAWLLVMQFVLFPPLLVAGRCFGVTPLEIVSVMLSHLLLTIQGATLGFWGALRGQTLADGLVHSVAALGRVIGLLVLLAVVASWAVTLLGGVTRLLFILPFPSFIAFLKVAWPVVANGVLFVGKVSGSFVGGATGLGLPLQSIPFISNYLLITPLIVGQFVGIALFLKWSAWSIDHPTRDFWGVTPEGKADLRRNDHMRVLYGVWSWELTTHQVNSFPVWERREPLAKIPSLLPSWEQTFSPAQSSLATSRSSEGPKTRSTPNRLRAPVSRRWQEVNPVLWLDLTRCLSLRSPDSAMLPILLTVGALGGSVLLAVSLFLFVGWIQNALGGARGDVSSLVTLWGNLRWMLTWAALACGPLWGAMGYVIERRTGMLVELRLTLITALAMWCGKFWARFGIFAALSIPLLSLVAFFAWNWPDKNTSYEVASALLSSWSLGAWSVCACLWLSDSCRRDLAAALWSGAFGLVWGLLLWNFPTFSWTPLHLLGATLAGGHLFWRLKRLGFG